MCGVAGWFASCPIDANDESRLQSMVRAISHRGPDGQGTLLQEHAAFGHSRLAIIDIQGGTQPMRSKDGRAAITFNGEIYNYREIKQRLINRGCLFNTSSDTEVILQLYLTEGRAGFSQLRGMYAFAIWDSEKKTGLLVRDPLGIKPLFLRANKNGTIEFASEAKAILARNGEQAELDENNLHLLMNFRYLPGRRSLFRNIIQLGPGQILEWQPAGMVREHKIPPPPPKSHDTTLDALRESVQAHFTADVEVGIYLSGGLDSAAITALGREYGQNALRTFTVDIGDDPNEAHNATRTAELLGVTNIQERTTQGLDNSLPRLVWHLEMPKINAFQVNRLAKLAGRHVKVVLSGLGGDEIFLGYNAHRIMHQASRVNAVLPKSLSNMAGRLGANLMSSLPGVRWSEPERAMLMLESSGDWPRIYGLLRNVWDTPSLRRLIYGPRMLDCEPTDAFDTLADLWPDRRDPVMAMAEFERDQKMINDLLWQEDRANMAEGVEARVPFVDIVLATEVCAFGREKLMPNGQPKGYMRDILRAILPQEVIARPKSGFQIDAPFFFEQHLAPQYSHLLDEHKVREIGLFNPEFVTYIRSQKIRKGLRWHYFMLYLMIMTHIWIEVFEQKNGWQ